MSEKQNQSPEKDLRSDIFENAGLETDKKRLQADQREVTAAVLGELPADIKSVIESISDNEEKKKVLDYLIQLNSVNEALRRKLEELARRNEELEKETVTDALTGLHSRKYYEDEVSSVFEAAKRHEHVFSIAAIDLDNFKQVNDVQGHLAGDEALRMFGVIINEEIRKEDRASRWGGDEMIIIFKETNAETAIHVLERIRARVEKELARFEVTMSAGVADFDPKRKEISSTEDLFKRADDALNEMSKKQGKNRITVFKEESFEVENN